MGRSRPSTSWSLSPAVLLLAGAAQLACYKPNIQEGGFKCNLDAGTKTCPEGFKCNAAKFCVKNLDGGVDRASDATDATDAADAADAGGPDVTCFASKPNCTPGDAGICDPFCQSGCNGCREKCSINAASMFTCNQVAPGPTPPLQAYCNVLSYQTLDQTDDCAPGQVCMMDGCSQHCYQYCRNDNDCTGAGCDREVVDGGQKACDVPFADCVPLPGSANSGCGTVPLTISCYISSSHPDRTLCDCPFGAGGSNARCRHSRDCNRGLACVDRANGQPAVCLQVCRLGSGDCNGNPNACHQYVGNPAGSVANQTYGYCF